MRTLIIVLFLVSCGAEDLVKKSKKDAAPADTSAPTATAPVQQAAQPSEQYASYAATSADLPTCKSANQNELIYVADVQSFKYCNVGGWVEIKVAGKDGKDGINAPDPINEKYLWKDPITSTLWMLPGALMPYTTGICLDPYRQPTVAESTLAAARGLKLAAISLSAPLVIWTSEENSNGMADYIYDMGHSPMQSNNALKTALGGNYCVHK